jgi:hypothetical protein
MPDSESRAARIERLGWVVGLLLVVSSACVGIAPSVRASIGEEAMPALVPAGVAPTLVECRRWLGPPLYLALARPCVSRPLLALPGSALADNPSQPLRLCDTDRHLIPFLSLRDHTTVGVAGASEVDPAISDKPLIPYTTNDDLRVADFQGEIINLPAQSIAPGDATLTIALDLPAGCKLSSEAPCALSVACSNPTLLSLSGCAQQTLTKPAFPAGIPLSAKQGEASLTVDLALYYCPKGEDLCCFKEIRLILPVRVREDQANNTLRLAYRVPSRP